MKGNLQLELVKVSVLTLKLTKYGRQISNNNKIHSTETLSLI